MLYTFFASLFVGNEKGGCFPPSSGRETAAAKMIPKRRCKSVGGSKIFRLAKIVSVINFCQLKNFFVNIIRMGCYLF